jgi:putative DNA primase/helicase
MTVSKIAAALGGARRSGMWWRCRCPVHQSRGATLALRDGERGLILKCWAGCDPLDVLAELRRRGVIASHNVGDRPRLPLPTILSDYDADAARRLAMARRIWNATHEARGTPVASYLAGRGITVDPPPSLRWAPRCRHPSGIYLPAMLARVDSLDGELIGVHRTFLQPDGSGKADIEPRKASLGPISGGAVRLTPATDTLLIGEGIETCMAALQATAMPTWAALSTAGMVALRLPLIAREIIILADHDANGAGERAAYAAADRWLGEGRRVRIAIPPKPGADFADVLLGRAHARIAEARDVAA